GVDLVDDVVNPPPQVPTDAGHQQTVEHRPGGKRNQEEDQPEGETDARSHRDVDDDRTKRCRAAESAAKRSYSSPSTFSRSGPGTGSTMGRGVQVKGLPVCVSSTRPSSRAWLASARGRSWIAARSERTMPSSSGLRKRRFFPWATVWKWDGTKRRPSSWR